MSITKILAMSAVVACAALFQGPALAVPINCYDGMDYTLSVADTLAGKNGGYGWNGAWAAPSTSNWKNAGADLTYTGLSTSGNSIVDPDGGGYLNTRPLPTGADTAGNSLWLSFLFNVPTDVTASNGFIQLFNYTNGIDSNVNGIGVSIAGNGNLQFVRSNLTFGASVGYTKGTTHFVVMRVDLGDSGVANSNVRLWLDPTISPTAPSDASANSTSLGTNIIYTGGAPNAANQLFVRGGYSFKSTYDEFHVADTWAGATTLIPEPATLGLLALGGLMMVHRGRR